MLTRLKPHVRESQDSDHDWVKTWIVLPAGIANDEIAQRWNHNPDGDYCQHSYDCCGNWYSDAIRIRRVNQRVLVTQNHYRNV
jgi:hypothetical protein